MSAAALPPGAPGAVVHEDGELEALGIRAPSRQAPHYYVAPCERNEPRVCQRDGCSRPAGDPVHLPPNTSWP